MERLETSGHRHQAAHVEQHRLQRPSQQQRCAEHGCEIVGVEAAREEHVHLAAVEFHECAVEVVLQYAAAEIGHGAQRISVAVCGSVLQHHLAVAVVGVGEREGVGCEAVEE